ncbi:MAG: phosphoadenosine phosphosulfate reductase family protein [Candidatus Njordarchaeota archaeon]
MHINDIVSYLSSRKFTVLWSGGKDSTATLLWILNKIQHEKWNIVYVEVTGNTHYLCNQYIHDIAKSLGVDNKLIHARRENLNFFECLEKWGVPIFGKHRWCLYQFKQKVFIEHSHFIQISGIRKSDSSRRKKVKMLEYFRQTKKIAVNPILNWSKRRVLQYIKKHEIPINPCYNLFRHSGNCVFCPYHSKKQIILTLQDASWRKKILNTLQRVEQRGYISKHLIHRWIYYGQQRTLINDNVCRYDIFSA